MTASAFTQYAAGGLNVINGAISLNAGTFQMVLMTSAYTPNYATDAHWSDISSHEVAAGGGYTQGGVTLINVAATESNGTLSISFGNPAWAAFSAIFKYGVIVQRAGSTLAPTDLLLCAFDVNPGGGSYAGTGASFLIQFAAGGVLSYMLNGLGDTYLNNLAAAGSIASNAMIGITQGGTDYAVPIAQLGLGTKALIGAGGTNQASAVTLTATTNFVSPGTATNNYVMAGTIDQSVINLNTGIIPLLWPPPGVSFLNINTGTAAAIETAASMIFVTPSLVVIR